MKHESKATVGRGALSLAVLVDVLDERGRQFAKHGDQSHLPDGTGPDKFILGGISRHLVHKGGDLETLTNGGLEHAAKARTKAASQNEGGDGSITFEMILTEEWAELVAEEDKARLYVELIQAAAVAVQWAEKLAMEGYRPRS